MRRKRATVAVAVTMAMGIAGIPPALLVSAEAATVGQGFTVTPSDLAFILKQIKIAEAHVANTTSATGPCGALVGTGPNQLAEPAALLRAADGRRLLQQPGRPARRRTALRTRCSRGWPRRRSRPPRRAARLRPCRTPGVHVVRAEVRATSSTRQPRTVSNLIVDQTSTNPAAVAAAGFPVRTQGNPGVVPCTTDPDPLADPPVAAAPADCTPSHETLFIPNVTTDVGLSPPYNSLFTLFGQFFDHGVDQTVKGGGTVFVPLKADDPLIAGPDHVLGNADDLPPAACGSWCSPGAGTSPVRRRHRGQPGHRRGRERRRHPGRGEHRLALGRPEPDLHLARLPPGRSCGSTSTTPRAARSRPASCSAANCRRCSRRPDTGMATWETTKEQAATLLGLQLVGHATYRHPDARGGRLREVHPRPAARACRST